MATEPTTPAPGFATEQLPTINRLGTALSFLGPLLIVLGVLRLGVGVVEMMRVSAMSGILYVPEGLLLAFAGLAFLAGATDAKFLHDVKGREKEHLSHTLGSVNAGYVALLILGCYIAFVSFVSFIKLLGLI